MIPNIAKGMLHPIADTIKVLHRMRSCICGWFNITKSPTFCAKGMYNVVHSLRGENYNQHGVWLRFSMQHTFHLLGLVPLGPHRWCHIFRSTPQIIHTTWSQTVKHTIRKQHCIKDCYLGLENTMQNNLGNHYVHWQII